MNSMELPCAPAQRQRARCALPRGVRATMNHLRPGTLSSVTCHGPIGHWDIRHLPPFSIETSVICKNGPLFSIRSPLASTSTSSRATALSPATITNGPGSFVVCILESMACPEARDRSVADINKAARPLACLQLAARPLARLRAQPVGERMFHGPRREGRI